MGLRRIATLDQTFAKDREAHKRGDKATAPEALSVDKYVSQAGKSGDGKGRVTGPSHSEKRKQKQKMGPFFQP